MDHLIGANSFERRYIFDSNERLADFDDSNNVLAVHTHSTLRTDDTLVTQVTSDGRDAGLAQTAGSFFYLKDSLGTISDVVDSSGNLIQHYVYSSFGKILKITDASEIVTTNPMLRPEFTFTNRELDEETGFYYYRARYYQAEIGRFIQQDPHPGKLHTPSSFINKYAYGYNNPIYFTDPTGMFNVGRELNNFFSNKEWLVDIGIAALGIAVIAGTGGAGAAAWAGAAKAVGATAIGSALASGAMAAFQGGSFWENFGNNFHANFRISIATLVIGALIEPWVSGISGALWRDKSSTWDSWSLYLGLGIVGLPYGGPGSGDRTWF